MGAEWTRYRGVYATDVNQPEKLQQILQGGWPVGQSPFFFSKGEEDQAVGIVYSMCCTTNAFCCGGTSVTLNNAIISAAGRPVDQSLFPSRQSLEALSKYGTGLQFLHYAMMFRVEGAVRILLQAGADVKARTTTGFTPFQLGVDFEASPDLLALVDPNQGSGAPRIQDMMARGNAKYFGFLSHYKKEAGLVARLLKTEMERELKERQEFRELFLDVDNLGNLNSLKSKVQESRTVILLQTQDVLTRPWVLSELVTAIQKKIPILTVIVSDSQYDFSTMSRYLLHLDTELEKANPGASQELLQQFPDLSMKTIAYMLSTAIPNVISKKFDGNADSANLAGMVKSIVNEAQNAQFVEPAVDFETWELRRS